MIGSGNADTEHVTRAASLVWSALDRLEEGVAVFDQRLELVYCNAPFRTLRDYPESVCRPGAHIANLYRHNAARGDYGSGDPEAAVAKRVALARTRKARAFDQRLADGTVLHVRYAPVPGGGLLFTYEDVSAKRRTEAALQSSERRAALVAEATTEGIYEWYIDAGEFHPSNRLMDLFGIQGEGINPSQWDWNRRVHPDDFEHYRIQLAAALKDDRARYACEYRVRREDGEYMWVMDRGVVSERDDAGRAVRFIGSLLDITDIKAAQERMRISEERYALAVEAVNEGVYDWDIAADSVYFSNKVRAVLGLTPEQLARPSDWSGRIHPDDAARYRAAMAAHLKGQSKRFECEVRYRRGDDSWGWARQHGIAIRDDSGRACRMIGATGDITEHKAMAAELTRQRAILEITLENMDQGISMVDKDLNVVAFNERFLELMQFPPERFRPGFPMEQALRYNAERGEYGPGDVELQVSERLEVARRFAPHRFQRTRGDGIVLEIVGNPVAGGGFVTTYTDVTERARAEQALRESEERHSLALEGSNDGIWDWNVRTDEITVSERLKELLGIDTPANVVTAAQWQSCIHPDDFECFREAIQSHLRGSSPQYVCEFRTIAGDGAERWVLHRGACVRDADGRVYRMAGSMGDITAHKRRERELREAKESAENTLEELRLAQKNLVHAEKMAALGELTAGIAHEIKNPLNFMNNFARTSAELVDEVRDAIEPLLDGLPVAEREDVEDLLETVKDDLGTIRRHGERADSIVKSMLLHSREGSPVFAPTDLNALVQESMNLAYHGQRASTPGFNVSLERDLDESAGEADMLPAEMTRVLLNLFTNAFYAVRSRDRDAGDGYAPTVKVSTRALTPDRLEVRVRDNGTGIEPGALARLFTPFFTTKPPGEGTGLGLSISHDIVVGLHGGSLRAQSEPGAYTEFIIELPRRVAARPD